MNDWRYDECEAVFYHEGVPASYYSVVDALNVSETRIAELEYNAANNAMSMHAILSALDINDETHGVSVDMYDDALGLAFKLNARITELTNLYLQTKEAFDLAEEMLLKFNTRINELENQIAELKPYRDGYDPHDKCPDEGENVIATKNGSMFIAQLRDNVWYDALGNRSEIRGGVERWWYLPESLEVRK